MVMWLQNINKQKGEFIKYPKKIVFMVCLLSKQKKPSEFFFGIQNSKTIPSKFCLLIEIDVSKISFEEKW